jgi:hypothetical protein
LSLELWVCQCYIQRLVGMKTAAAMVAHVPTPCMCFVYPQAHLNCSKSVAG